MPRLTSLSSKQALTVVGSAGRLTIPAPVLRRNLHFATSSITGSGDRQVLALSNLLDTDYLNDVVDIFAAAVFTASSIELTTGQTVTDNLRWNNSIGPPYNINLQGEGIRSWGADVAVISPNLNAINNRNTKTRLVKGTDFDSTSDTSAGGTASIGFTNPGTSLADVFTIAGSTLQGYPVKITTSTGNFSINYVQRTDANTLTVLNLDSLGYPSSSILSFTDIASIEILEFNSRLSYSPTYLLKAGATSYNEGATVTFTLYTTNIPTNTILPYAVSGISVADLDSGSIAGNFTIGADGTATVSWTLSEDSATEGTETMTVLLLGDLASASTSINDTSVNVNYTLASSEGTTVTEGTAFTITLTTVGIADGTELGYTVSGINSADLTTGELSGIFTISSNSASADFEIAEDRLTEGLETFTLSLDNGAASISIVITDSSLTPSFSLARSTGTVTEGNSVTIFVNTVNIEDGFSVPYTVTGINADDLSSGSLTGNVAISDNQGSVAFTLAEDITTEGAETLTFTISPDVPGSPTDSIQVTVGDTSQNPVYNSLEFGQSVYSEGDTVTFTITAPNVPSGTTVGFTVSNSDGANGTATFNSEGSGTGSFTLTADTTTEGSETVTVTLNSTDSRGGSTSSISANFTALDASIGSVQTLTSPTTTIQHPFGASNATTGNRFGDSFAADNTWVYIGQPGTDYNNYEYVHRYAQSSASRGGDYRQIIGDGDYENFGESISVRQNGSRLYISRPSFLYDSEFKGEIKVYYPTTTGNVLRQTFRDADSENLGGAFLGADPVDGGNIYTVSQSHATSGLYRLYVFNQDGDVVLEETVSSHLPRLWVGDSDVNYWAHSIDNTTIRVRNKSNNSIAYTIDTSGDLPSGTWTMGSSDGVTPNIWYDSVNGRSMLFVTYYSTTFANKARLFAYDIISTNLVWSYSHEDQSSSTCFSASCISVSDHYLAVSTTDGTGVQVFDPRTGNRIYKLIPSVSAFFSKCIVVDNQVWMGYPTYNRQVGPSTYATGLACRYVLNNNAP